MEFTLTGAMHAARKGNLENWVHAFLQGPADNHAFSDGLRRQERYWLGPVEVPIGSIERCCGPEAHMEYVISAVSWQKRTEFFQEMLRNDWDMPPLIGQLDAGKVSVRDGNHRLGALEAMNMPRASIIVWHDQGQEPLQQWLCAVCRDTDAV